MIKIFIVVAFGGQYEDHWHINLLGFSNREDAEAIIAKYEDWLSKIRSIPLPTLLEVWERDRDVEAYELRLDMFQSNVLDDLGVEEIHRDWLLQNWDSTHDCEKPSYSIEELDVL